MPKVSNVAVIVRGSHERTESLCVDIAKQHVPEAHLVLIHERPFSTALRRGFEIGRDLNLEWTLCLDADLLMAENAVQQLVAAVQSAPDSVFGGHGVLLDKLFGEHRYGGPHLYRTSLLDEALKHIPDTDVSLRPETHVKVVMNERGHDWVKVDQLFAVHEYEQFYRDLYRKMLVRAHKSPNWAPKLLRRFEILSRHDTDFLAAAWGMRVGMGRADQILLDVEQYTDEVGTLLLAHGIREKEALTPDLHLADTLIRKYTGQRGGLKKTTLPQNAPLIQRGVWWTGYLLGRAAERIQYWAS